MSEHECATLHHSQRAALDAGSDLLWGADLRNVSSRRSVLEHGLLCVEKGLILQFDFRRFSYRRLSSSLSKILSNKSFRSKESFILFMQNIYMPHLKLFINCCKTFYSSLYYSIFSVSTITIKMLKILINR